MAQCNVSIAMKLVFFYFSSVSFLSLSMSINPTQLCATANPLHSLDCAVAIEKVIFLWQKKNWCLFIFVSDVRIWRIRSGDQQNYKQGIASFNPSIYTELPCEREPKCFLYLYVNNTHSFVQFQSFLS